MSEQERIHHFLDLNWTITLTRFFGKRSRRWIESILIEDADHDAKFTVSVKEAENLIRLLSLAIARVNVWESLAQTEENKEREQANGDQLSDEERDLASVD